MRSASDKNKDGKLTPDEFADQARADAMPFTDLNGDNAVSVDEWDYYKAAMDSENGMLAITLGGSGRHDREVGEVGVSPRRAAAAVADHVRGRALHGQRRRDRDHSETGRRGS